jgi:hypothetical protein
VLEVFDENGAWDDMRSERLVFSRRNDERTLKVLLHHLAQSLCRK